MGDPLTFERENRERIQAVENSFGPSGKPLYQKDRILLGEGRLIKHSHRKPSAKVFFLFNDVLVYGSIILNNRWHKNQKILPLENVLLEDMEDGEKVKNQWLIRTPSKSFVVSAFSPEEKNSWMEHIKESRANLLQSRGLQPGTKFAVSWVPDQTTNKCMLCLSKFTVTRRRHHCRKCGFVVCNSCSKERELIDHIHPTKQLRVCSQCHTGNLEEEDTSRLREDSVGTNTSEDDNLEQSIDEEEMMLMLQSHIPSSWLDFRRGTWGHMNNYSKPGPTLNRPHSCIA